MPADQRSYLDQLLSTLWPGCAVEHGRGRNGAGRADAAAEFVVVPSAQRPRLVLPRRPRRATASALRHYKASATGSERRRIRLMSAAARLGCADLLPSQVSLVRRVPGACDVTGYLTEALGRPVRASLYIGPPRAVQKPILQLLTAEGETLAFAKVGVTPLTRRLVRGEGDCLERLATAPLSALRLPEVVHRGTWDGNEVLVLGAVPVARRGGIGAGLLAEAVAEVAALEGRHVAVLAESRYWAALTSRVEALAPSGSAGRLRQALRDLAPAAATTSLPFGSWHGDWAPWNMAPSGGRVAVWDWEKFERDVPIGFDAVHYLVQSAVVGLDTDPATAFATATASAPALLRPFALDAEPARLVVTLYAVDIACRYLADGEVDLDATRMARIHEWLDPVLHDRLAPV